MVQRRRKHEHGNDCERDRLAWQQGGGTVERRGRKRWPPWRPRSKSLPPPGEGSASAGPAPATERNGSRAVRPTEDDGRKDEEGGRRRRYSRVRIRAASARRQAWWRIGGSQARGRGGGGAARESPGFGGSGRLSSLVQEDGRMGWSGWDWSFCFARPRTLRNKKHTGADMRRRSHLR
jgi:hypothetical protein